jgi:hypothetical protein
MRDESAEFSLNRAPAQRVGSGGYVDAERAKRRSHAERGNEVTNPSIITKEFAHADDLGTSARGTSRRGGWTT